MTQKKRCKWGYLNDNIAIKHAAGWIWTNQALLCVLGETVSNDWGWDVSVYFICYVQSLNIWCLRPHTQHFILSFYAALLILWRSLCPALLDWRWLLCKYHLQVALHHATQINVKFPRKRRKKKKNNLVPSIEKKSTSFTFLKNNHPFIKWKKVLAAAWGRYFHLFRTPVLAVV